MEERSSTQSTNVNPEKPVASQVVEVTRQPDGTSLNIVYKSPSGRVKIDKTIDFKKKMSDAKIKRLGKVLYLHQVEEANTGKKNKSGITGLSGLTGYQDFNVKNCQSNMKGRQNEPQQNGYTAKNRHLQSSQYQGAFKEFLSVPHEVLPTLLTSSYKQPERFPYSILLPPNTDSQTHTLSQAVHDSGFPATNRRRKGQQQSPKPRRTAPSKPHSASQAIQELDIDATNRMKEVRRHSHPQMNHSAPISIQIPNNRLQISQSQPSVTVEVVPKFQVNIHCSTNANSTEPPPMQYENAFEDFLSTDKSPLRATESMYQPYHRKLLGRRVSEGPYVRKTVSKANTKYQIPKKNKKSAVKVMAAKTPSPLKTFSTQKSSNRPGGTASQAADLSSFEKNQFADQSEFGSLCNLVADFYKKRSKSQLAEKTATQQPVRTQPMASQSDVRTQQTGNLSPISTSLPASQSPVRTHQLTSQPTVTSHPTTSQPLIDLTARGSTNIQPISCRTDQVSAKKNSSPCKQSVNRVSQSASQSVLDYSMNATIRALQNVQKYKESHAPIQSYRLFNQSGSNMTHTSRRSNRKNQPLIDLTIESNQQSSNNTLERVVQGIIPSGYTWLNTNTNGRVIISESSDKQLLNIVYRDDDGNVMFNKYIKKRHVGKLRENLQNQQNAEKQGSKKTISSEGITLCKNLHENREVGSNRTRSPLLLKLSKQKSGRWRRCENLAGLKERLAHNANNYGGTHASPSKMSGKNKRLLDEHAIVIDDEIDEIIIDDEEHEEENNKLQGDVHSESVSLSLADSIMQSLDNFFGLHQIDHDDMQIDRGQAGFQATETVGRPEDALHEGPAVTPLVIQPCDPESLNQESPNIEHFPLDNVALPYNVDPDTEGISWFDITSVRNITVEQYDKILQQDSSVQPLPHQQGQPMPNQQGQPMPNQQGQPMPNQQGHPMPHQQGHPMPHQQGHPMPHQQTQPMPKHQSLSPCPSLVSRLGQQAFGGLGQPGLQRHKGIQQADIEPVRESQVHKTQHSNRMCPITIRGLGQQAFGGFGQPMPEQNTTTQPPVVNPVASQVHHISHGHRMYPAIVSRLGQQAFGGLANSMPPQLDSSTTPMDSTASPCLNITSSNHLPSTVSSLASREKSKPYVNTGKLSYHNMKSNSGAHRSSPDEGLHLRKHSGRFKDPSRMHQNVVKDKIRLMPDAGKDRVEDPSCTHPVSVKHCSKKHLDGTAKSTCSQSDKARHESRVISDEENSYNMTHDVLDTIPTRPYQDGKPDEDTNESEDDIIETTDFRDQDVHDEGLYEAKDADDDDEEDDEDDTADVNLDETVDVQPDESVDCVIEVDMSMPEDVEEDVENDQDGMITDKDENGKGGNKDEDQNDDTGDDVMDTTTVTEQQDQTEETNRTDPDESVAEDTNEEVDDEMEEGENLEAAEESDVDLDKIANDLLETDDTDGVQKKDKKNSDKTTYPGQENVADRGENVERDVDDFLEANGPDDDLDEDQKNDEDVDDMIDNVVDYAVERAVVNDKVEGNNSEDGTEMYENDINEDVNDNLSNVVDNVDHVAHNNEKVERALDDETDDISKEIAEIADDLVESDKDDEDQEGENVMDSIDLTEDDEDPWWEMNPTEWSVS